jgi:hypothetical protein
MWPRMWNVARCGGVVNLEGDNRGWGWSWGLGEKKGEV